MTVQAEALASEKEFTRIASDEQIARTIKALEENGVHTQTAQDGDEARRLFFELIPDGSEVFLGASVTLETLGIKDIIDKSGRFVALRPKMFAMNRETQAREIRKIGAAPDYAAGSVHAVTEAGQVVVASKSGSQLGPYVSGAGKVVWVVGAQKLVKDLHEALRRVEEHVMPLENTHMQQLYHIDTRLNKIVIINHEDRPGRLNMIIVKEKLGF